MCPLKKEEQVHWTCMKKNWALKFERNWRNDKSDSLEIKSGIFMYFA